MAAPVDVAKPVKKKTVKERRAGGAQGGKTSAERSAEKKSADTASPKAAKKPTKTASTKKASTTEDGQGSVGSGGGRGAGRGKSSGGKGGRGGASGYVDRRWTGDKWYEDETGFADDQQDEENPGMLLTDLVNRPDSREAASLLSKSRSTTGSKKKKPAAAVVKAPKRKKDSDDILAEMLEGLGDDDNGLGFGDQSDEEAAPQLQTSLAAVGKAHDPDDADEPVARQMAAPESEFHAGDADDVVTVQDLLDSAAGTSGLGDVRRQLQGLAYAEALPEPMSEPKRGREERAAQYDSSSKDAGKWIPQVQQMRKADQIELITADHENAYQPQSTQGIVGTFREADDFEKELRELIDASGTTEDAMRGAQALPMNTTIRDEKQTRQVAKLKALMLREQVTNKRLKKIKSKAYRRIHRKAESRDREALLERLEVENPEMAKSLKQEYEKKHAEKRMLRNRNARRKWATTMQRFAKGDANAQKEITKQAQAAHDEEKALRRAVKGKEVDQDDESDAVDLSDSEGDDEGKSLRKQTMDKAKKLTIGEIKGLKDGGELPTTGILGMGFMRDAIKRKREEAQSEAQNVLRELESMDAKLDADQADSDDEEAVAAKRKELEEQNRQKKPAKSYSVDELAQARKEVDAILEQDDIATECTVSGPLTVHAVAADKMTKPAPNFRVAAKRAAAAAAKVTEDAATPSLPSSGPSKKRSKASAKSSAATEDAAENPWLSTEQPTEEASALADANPWLQDTAAAEDAGSDGDVSASKSARRETKKPGKEKPKATKKGRKRKDSQDNEEDAAESAGEEETRNSTEAMDADDVLAALNADSETMREQRQLVRTAFVQGTQAEDFDAEVEDEERQKEEASKPVEMVGWGSWTGEGVQPRKPKGKGKGKGKADDKATPEPEKKKIQRVQFLVDSNKKAEGKYFVEAVPFPFQNPQQYDREMRMPSGPEWNTRETFKQKVKPKVHLKAGAIVPPLQYVKHLPPEQRDGAIEAWGSAKQPKRLKARF